MNDKKSKTVLNSFIEILAKFKCKSNKLWVDQGRFFYKIFMQKWLKSIDILIYSTHNEGKSVVAERFKIFLKGKVFRKGQLIMKNIILVVWIS